jgi:DNA-binding CsgD family transcriptional regulator
MQAPAAYLLITNVQPSVWHAAVFNDPQVIGRLPECDIVIPPTYIHVSRRHALIGARRQGIWLQDLGSSGGTRLNGVPLRPDCESSAVIGDRLSLAGLELFLVSPEAKVLAGIHSHGSSAVKSEEEECSQTGVKLLGSESLTSYNEKLLGHLTPAELEVVRWVCRGRTTIKEIGDGLFRSPHTVRTQLNSVYKKLGVHSRDELLAFMRYCETAWTKPEGANADGSQATS